MGVAIAVYLLLCNYVRYEKRTLGFILWFMKRKDVAYEYISCG